jgi:predicted kinase
MVEEDRENTELPALGSDREQTNLDRPGEQDTPAVAPPTAVEASRQRRGRGRGRRRGRRAGKPERSSQPAPLAPAYPEERYQPPVSEVAPDLPAAAAPKAQPAAIPSRQPPKKPRGVVVLTIGLPGSGKSSWFKRRGVSPLSSDMLRALLFDDITEQRYQDLVFSTLRSLLRARLIAGMPWNYIDATNLSPKERHGWIKMAHDFGYEVHAVFFDVPLEVCKERNQRRGRVVPDDVMQRMAHKLRPPTFEEGFSKIIVVRVKHSDKEPQAREESGSRPDAESAD